MCRKLATTLNISAGAAISGYGASTNIDFAYLNKQEASNFYAPFSSSSLLLYIPSHPPLFSPSHDHRLVPTAHRQY